VVAIGTSRKQEKQEVRPAGTILTPGRLWSSV
jgi:hypothetical protein